MYSYKQRKKAVEISQQTRSLGKTLQIPGYPSSKKLYKRIHEYQQNGELYKNESNLNAYTIMKKKKLPHLLLLKHALLAENAVGIPLVKQ